MKGKGYSRNLVLRNVWVRGRMGDKGSRTGLCLELINIQRGSQIRKGKGSKKRSEMTQHGIKSGRKERLVRERGGIGVGRRSRH